MGPRIKWKAWLQCFLFLAAIAGVFQHLMDQPDTVTGDGVQTKWVPAIDSFKDVRMHWSQGEPNKHKNGGEWRTEGEELVIVPAPNRDYWSKTFYSPLLVKHDAQTLVTTVPAHAEATLTTAFTLTPVAQFDQAGIMIIVDDETWVKAGIEYTDGVPRLSCVVTNDGYSDWSTQHWPDWDKVAVRVAVCLALPLLRQFASWCLLNAFCCSQRSTSIRVRVSKVHPGGAQVSNPHLILTSSSPHPHLILTAGPRHRHGSRRV